MIQTTTFGSINYDNIGYYSNNISVTYVDTIGVDDDMSRRIFNTRQMVLELCYSNMVCMCYNSGMWYIVPSFGMSEDIKVITEIIDG